MVVIYAVIVAVFMVVCDSHLYVAMISVVYIHNSYVVNRQRNQKRVVGVVIGCVCL